MVKGFRLYGMVSKPLSQSMQSQHAGERRMRE